MAKKRTVPVSPPDRPMFVTWDDDKGRALAMKTAGDALRRSEPVVRSHGSDVFLDIAPNNVSVRDGFSRRDYEDFRKGEALPSRPKEIIKCCMDAYDTVGVLRNVVDLMGDFSTQGIDLNHPNERIEKWHKEWFRRVGGKERSERFVNLLYRTGNVVVKRSTAKLTVRQEDQMKRAQAAPDLTPVMGPDVERREVPWRYKFLNPLSLEVLADELAVFVGDDNLSFGVKIPKTLAARIKEPKGATEKALVRKLPADLVRAVRNGEHVVPLDPEKVRAFYYKRDDWQAWAKPMASSILGDLQVLQKMKLADLAALDGAISCIRVWKLGSLPDKILPTEFAIARLAEMLANNVGGGVMDLVWDAAIDLVETSTDVHQFLGSTKYEPVLTAIYAGLGIPPTLTGAASQGGFTNNFISLKTLTERLQYGRDLLVAFWDEELRIVQKAMGFRFPATVVFDRMTLSDEAAEKQLLINLADRDIISWESVVESFGRTPEIEEVRLRREARRREAGRLPEKASPFHAPNKSHDLKKGLLNQGSVTPSQVGLDLPPAKDGEVPFVDKQNEHQAKMARDKQAAKPKGQPGQGRPFNSKDKKKRKKKVVKPRTSAEFFRVMGWAENAQAAITKYVGEGYLRGLGKKNFRELTDQEAAAFERYKFGVLFQMEPESAIDREAVLGVARAGGDAPPQASLLLKESVSKHAESRGKEPTLEDVRRYQAGVYAMWKGDFGE